MRCIVRGNPAMSRKMAQLGWPAVGTNDGTKNRLGRDDISRVDGCHIRRWGAGHVGLVAHFLDRLGAESAGRGVVHPDTYAPVGHVNNWMISTDTRL